MPFRRFVVKRSEGLVKIRLIRVVEQGDYRLGLHRPATYISDMSCRTDLCRTTREITRWRLS